MLARDEYERAPFFLWPHATSRETTPDLSHWTNWLDNICHDFLRQILHLEIGLVRWPGLLYWIVRLEDFMTPVIRHSKYAILSLSLTCTRTHTHTTFGRFRSIECFVKGVDFIVNEGTMNLIASYRSLWYDTQSVQWLDVLCCSKIYAEFCTLLLVLTLFFFFFF